MFQRGDNNTLIWRRTLDESAAVKERKRRKSSHVAGNITIFCSSPFYPLN
jgi:hypothetical protein